MKYFAVDLGTMMMRYYLMMAIIIVAGFTGTWLLAYLAVPVFLSAILGVGFFDRDSKAAIHQSDMRVTDRSDIFKEAA